MIVYLKRLNEGAANFVRATIGASGYDVVSTRPRTILFPGERVLFSTGWSMAIPEGYEAVVRPRSGMALRSGVTVCNSPGTIDSDYRGEVGVILINLGNEKVTIEPGDRIAQIVFQKVEHVQFEIVDDGSSLPAHAGGPGGRGTGGFGSTGK